MNIGVITGEDYTDIGSGTTCGTCSLADCAHHLAPPTVYLACPSSEYSTPSLSARSDSSHSKAYSEDTQKAAPYKESIRIRCSTVPSRVVNLATRDLYFCRACQLIADLILNQCVSQPPVDAVATLPENHHPSVERRLCRVAQQL